ncbi:MAG TPA: aldehyde dehydrogenase family protein [Micropepsaceae bacterium]|nr:aldehyde dehydrogenase family protein [Micropepsaceae bacterium]
MDTLVHGEQFLGLDGEGSITAPAAVRDGSHGGGIEVPFGGYKQSGFGRDKSLHAIDKYSQLKTTYITVG